MGKKYLVQSMTVLVLGFMTASCSKEDMFTQADAVKNAENLLGITINPNTDWNMTTQVTANITVTLGLDQSYTVVVYDENPLFNDKAFYYLKTTVKEGETVVHSFSIPSAKKTLYAAAYDSKKRSVVETITVEGSTMNINIGGIEGTRATEDASTYPDYVRTLNDYLNPTTGRNSYGQTWELNTKPITVNEMRSYTAFTDADLDKFSAEGNTNYTITNGYTVRTEGHMEGTPGHNVYDENGNWLAWDPGDEHWVEGTSYDTFLNNGDGKHYRIASGVEVTRVFHANGDNGVVNDVVLYVEGTLHLNGNTLNGPTIVVASGGEVIIDGDTNMSNAGRIVVMAGGTVSGNNGVTFNVNNGSQCYNAGTISFNGELNVNGTDFYNNGIINVDLLRNTSGGVFTNFGNITARTNINAADTYNSIVINGCYMHYTEDAGIGTLTLLDNSRLDVDGQAQFAGTATLYNNSIVHANTLYLTNTVFAGPTIAGQIAIVKTNKIMVGQGADLGATGRTYFDWNYKQIYNKENEKQTLDNEHSILGYVKAQKFKYTNEATSAFTIPEGECTGAGYNPQSPIVEEDIPGSPAVWTYAFEDSWICDYDMNDVVIKVCENADDPSRLDVTLCCTGASYNLYLYLDNEKLFGGREVHAVLGGTSGKFINTAEPGHRSDSRFETTQTVTTQIDKPANFDFGTADFWILSPEGEIHVSSEGQDPHGVAIPGDWQWPTEWTRITTAYPDFTDFANDASHQTNVTWYNNAVSSEVYQ